MKVGDIVTYKDGKGVLRCGSGVYDRAIVTSVDPFGLVSEGGDMRRAGAWLVPRKPESEESLPQVRVRLRQIGGLRTRFVSVRATSIAQAAERVRSELSGLASCGDDAWEVLEITPSDDSSAARRA